MTTEKHVTCGSAIKIAIPSKSKSKFYLHSNHQNWSSGSGQQIVTFNSDLELLPLWMVIEPYSKDSKACMTGTPLKCNDIIRLVHVATDKYLHSHHVQANLSREQEVSGFGGENESDESDNWKVECIGNQGGGDNTQYWLRNERIRLKHVITQKYLSVSSSHTYTDQNCPHCPIVGHREAYTSSGSGNTVFKVEDAVHLYTIES